MNAAKTDTGLIATHTGTLQLGDIKVGCAVLSNGQRVIYRRAFNLALGRAPNASNHRNRLKSFRNVKLPDFVAADNLKPFISNRLVETSNPIHFLHEHSGPGVGYDAKLLPEVCKTYLRARRAGAARKNQLHIAARCEILQEAFAEVGVIALIDEATGYQELRGQSELNTALSKLLAPALQPWNKRFPNEYYRQICRLWGMAYNENSSRRSGLIGAITGDIVYGRLAVELLEELRQRNPLSHTGHRRFKHHQWLSPDVGHLALDRQITICIALMQAEEGWDAFMMKLDRVTPRQRHGRIVVVNPTPEQQLRLFPAS